VTPLDFGHQRDANSASFERADPEAVLIERRAWNRFLVTLPDGEHCHEVRLEKRNGAFAGECRLPEEGDEYDEQQRCPARKYNNDSLPCAHLCTIRKALVFNDRADDGTTIEVFERDEIEIAAADTHIEDAMADSGREVRR
jgi:hypothetical protein